MTVSALVVPKALGYAGIAGVPIQNGLYAAAAGSLIYAIFGTSRQISTGPSSALAAVAASTLLATGVSDGEDSIAIVTAITMLSGLMFILLAVFRMGWISQFLSKAVITGFLFGAAIEVVIGELPKLTSTQVTGSNAWQKLGSWLGTLDEIHTASLVVGLAALVLIIAVRFLAASVPGALVLVVGGLMASWIFDLEGRGVALVGEVPRGFAAPGLPDLQLFLDNAALITTAALGLLLIGFSQSAGDARSFAARHQYPIDINQESLAQGMSNVGSSVVQGIPVSTSLSASSLNDSSGAKSPLASLTTGLAIVLTLIALAPLFSDLPKPVLAALIIDAVVFGMMDIAEMKRLFRVDRFDFWIAIASIVAVILAGVLAGVAIGVVLSIGWLIYVSATPESPELGRRPGSEVFRSLSEYPDYERHEGLLVLRFDGGLFFCTADALEDRIREAALDRAEPIRAVVIDFEGVNFIDSQGAAKITEIQTLAEGAGLTLHLARVKPEVLWVLVADGAVARLGRDHFHGHVHGAVVAAMDDMRTPLTEG